MKILFGCGKIGKKAYEHVKDISHDKLLFCDNNPE